MKSFVVEKLHAQQRNVCGERVSYSCQEFCDRDVSDYVVFGRVCI